mmetsp:Transcript_36969/g.81181  ORF Transcript_36969/g.81181 Transcript_36969/m.81181 type:complete len:186 (+) Transcript_36969:57-614(+)
MLQNNVPNAGSFRYKTGTTVLVSGLAPGVKKTDLQAAFGDFGQILRVDLDIGKAFLEFEDARDAEDAIKEMDGHKLKDRRIRLAFSKPKEVNTNTPLHGAKGTQTVDRRGREAILGEVRARSPESRAAGPGLDRSRNRSRSPRSRVRSAGAGRRRSEPRRSLSSPRRSRSSPRRSPSRRERRAFR